MFQNNILRRSYKGILTICLRDVYKFIRRIIILEVDVTLSFNLNDNLNQGLQFWIAEISQSWTIKRTESVKEK